MAREQAAQARRLELDEPVGGEAGKGRGERLRRDDGPRERIGGALAPA